MFILDFIVMHRTMMLGVCVAVLVLFLIIFRSSLIRLEILQRIGAIGPYATVTALIATAIWAGDRWQTDATLKYIDKFIDREYAESLWSIQEFTLCLEKKNNHHISYVPGISLAAANALLSFPPMKQIQPPAPRAYDAGNLNIVSLPLARARPGGWCAPRCFRRCDKWMKVRAVAGYCLSAIVQCIAGAPSSAE